MANVYNRYLSQNEKRKVILALNTYNELKVCCIVTYYVINYSVWKYYLVKKQLEPVRRRQLSNRVAFTHCKPSHKK